MNRLNPRITAALGTLIAAVIILLWLLMSHISLVQQPVEKPSITMAQIDEEEFVEVLEEPHEMPAPGQEAAPAQNPIVEDNQSVAAPAPGQDLKDNGPKGEPAKPVTSNRPSPVKEEKPKGPTPQEIAAREQQKKEEEAKRQANNAMSNAFADNGGKNNTDNNGKNPGNSGKPNGQASQENGKGVSATGSRNLGKWGAPASSKVAMSEVGKITVAFDLHPDGTISNLEIISAKTNPPAYTSNKKIRDGLAAEIKDYYRRKAKSMSGQTETIHGTITYLIK